MRGFMKRVAIEVMAIACHEQLMEKYELAQENACDMRLGQKFVSIDAAKPQGLCDSAWQTLKPFVEELARGGGHFYGEWMKDPHSAMISCNDGFRPVSFLLEAID